ncbi:hexosaminidase [Cnuella takakiae]|uniref:beta-N-acetylhexosaminidase n=1 Tax=Cnuella takakiae TaxID=1302690 RepID=A0A1M4XXK6_9BACT|nr:family 20 glycosylhydrolase [Cnuella takakiae]OLY92977.1 hypothetical protein BUE76_14555 [Cnuella takakiae]SHE98086.1 hexosaminidase [Cnuella takakiae]
MRIIPVLLLLLIFSCTATSQQVSIIPKPLSLTVKPGRFLLTANTPLIAATAGEEAGAKIFNEYLQQYYGFSLPISTSQNGGNKGIVLRTRNFIKAPDKDAYQLSVNQNGVSIEGDTHAGTFYGLQTLLQLLPVDKHQGDISIPLVQVQDAPRFDYRGMHLDVARHFFPISFVKKYIDYIALHKMNYFHWHLTDDQGWRIEIKKYPRLVEVGAYRDGTIIGHYPGKGNDQIRYGGYYTQEEIKEIVRYAAQRHITVVPEIEMPGHALAALTSYPNLGCPGTGPYQVAQTWGVFDDVFCAGNDSTFLFLQDVLDEVLPLFPSPYIHVGGDECPKENWIHCPRCQQRIKKEGLKDEHELQSYFIQRMEKYVNSKGRTIIGWDEILEGGLAPNAMVMSWRGEAGGIAAAKQKHQVIMTPGSHCYLDHSQSTQEDSVTFGGFTPVEKVYAYEPIPKELNAEQAKYIIGAQSNLWTEYIAYPLKVEYQIFPRMSAMSEVLWSAKGQRNWPEFEKRMQTQYKRYELWGANYSNAYFEIKAAIAPTKDNSGLLLQLESKDRQATVQYGISGLHFAKNYTAPVLIQQSGEVTALVNRNGKIIDSTTIKFRFNKATGKKVSLSEQPAPNYPGSGAFTLVDGVINEKGMDRTKEFIGYNGKTITATIDLGSPQDISEVRLHTLFASGSWIYPPQEMEVQVSTDGKTYQRMGSARELLAKDPVKGYLGVVIDAPVQARFVRVKAQAVQKIAEHMAGAGQKAWMFLDEIEVL